MQKNENRSISIILHKTQVQIKLNIKWYTLDLIKQKVGNSLEHTGTGDNFLNRASMAQALRSTIDKWDLMKLKSFCKAKDIINMTYQQPTDWEMIFTNPTSGYQRANL